MQLQLNELQNLILAPQTLHGQNLYILTHSSHINAGDESELRTLIFASWGLEKITNLENPDPKLENDALDKDQLLGRMLNEWTPSDTKINSWTKIKTSNMITRWENAAGDNITIQFTDANIYIIAMNSGQY